MKTRQLIDYAKENGYNSVKFSIKKDGVIIATGKFLDAYYEFIKIPVCGDGFLTLSDLEKELGYELDFDILDDDEYKNITRVCFLIRGMVVPEEYESEAEEDVEIH